MMDTLAMGGYGAYVWSSFALMFIVMVACVGQARGRQRRVYQDIEKRLRAMEASK